MMTKQKRFMRGNKLFGLQFHPESILTTNGVRIIYDALRYLLK